MAPDPANPLFGWRRLAALALAALTGLIFHALGVPLAWILGPLISTALLSIAGWPVFSSLRGRRLGQLVIGAGLGLNITAALVAAMLPWLPVMVAVSLLSVTVTSFFSVFLARLADLDRVTAYFAMMSAGLSEMATSAPRWARGANP